MQRIENLQQLRAVQTVHESFLLLLFYSDQSRGSVEARTVLERIESEKPDLAIAAVNVAKTREVHPEFNVSSVPTVLSLKRGREAKRLEGLQSEALYLALLNDAPVRRSDGTEAPARRVTVYSTSTCPHCNTIKRHLRKHGIRFTDVDVGRDARAAESLVRRSGNTGVPQTDVNGTIVLGADIAKLNKLLGIH